MKNNQKTSFWKKVFAAVLLALVVLGMCRAARMPIGAIPQTGVSAEMLRTVLRSETFTASQESVVLQALHNGMYALLFFEFCVLLAAALLAVYASIRNSLKERVRRQIRALAAVVLDAGIWVLTDSDLLALKTDRIVLVSFVSLVSFGLLVPLTVEFIRFALREAPPVLRNVQAAELLLLGVDIVGWYFGGLAMFWMLVPMHMVLLCSIVLCIKATWKEYRRYPGKELMDILAAFVCLTVCSLAALVLFYLQMGRSYAKMYCIGLLLFLILQGWAVARRVQQDLNDQYQLETYKKLAYLDALTGLSNYAAFKNHQQQWAARQDWVYIMLDVNGLKSANDHFGHAVGDELIQSAASCIREAFYRADGWYRIGGDEFAVVWPNADEQLVRRSVERLRKLCREQENGGTCAVSVAVGYAFQKGRAMTSEELLHEADVRMYRNKARLKTLQKTVSR